MLRVLLLLVVVAGLGGFLFLILHDQPPPIRTVTIDVPDSQLPQ